MNEHQVFEYLGIALALNLTGAVGKMISVFLTSYVRARRGEPLNR